MPKTKPATKIILGIDPGFAITGYALLKIADKKPQVVTYGTITTTPDQVLSERLKIMQKQLDKLIKKYRPAVMAIEKLFFSKNTKTAIDVGQARGAIILTAALNNVSIKEYTPLQIKQAATSYGRADKRQLQKMIQLILGLEKMPTPDDAADALAVAWFCSLNY